MNIALLDLNDANLQLWHGSTHLQSPGYALLQGKQYRFGSAARAAARLQPRDINTRYWWQLSTEPLQPALGPARHTGDLVHAHLQELHREAGEPQEVLLAVSGSMQRDQLALLLGITQQCPFAAVGLVNRSVALGSLYGGSGRLFHLEVQLHQAVISELAREGGRVELRRTVPLPGCGLLQLQERLVESIATAFIRQTRFDPRRKAATEQQLYDTLPDTLRQLGQASESNLEINGYQARISRSELYGAGQRLFDSAPEVMGVTNSDDSLIADPLAGLLPGFREKFAGVELLAGDSVHHALQQHCEQLVQRDQPLSFITSLPCLQENDLPPGQAGHTPTHTPQPEPEPQAVPVAQPTHLLQGSLARPLRESGLDLGAGCELFYGAESWQLRGDISAARLNGSAYRQGQALACGDTLQIGSAGQMNLIEVESGE